MCYHECLTGVPWELRVGGAWPAGGKHCPVDWEEEHDFLGQVTEMGFLKGW